jgi:hypothetical protein
MTNPTVGRVVHYLSHGSPVLPDGTQHYKPECRAAIVTAIGDIGRVGLAVLNPTGLFFDQACPQDEGLCCGGTWHWPERVE